MSRASARTQPPADSLAGESAEVTQPVDSAELTALIDNNDQLRARNEQLQRQLAEIQPGQVAALLQKIRDLEERDALRASPLHEISIDQVRASVGKNSNESAASTAVRWRIVVARSTDAREADEVKIGVNGRLYQIRRGVPVDVPPEAVLALEDAVVSTPIRNEHDQITGWHHAPRFPYQNLGQSVSEDGTPLM